MLLNQYANNIWREHFRISRQTFQFICNLVRPHLVRQDLVVLANLVAKVLVVLANLVAKVQVVVVVETILRAAI